MSNILKIIIFTCFISLLIDRVTATSQYPIILFIIKKYLDNLYNIA